MEQSSKYDGLGLRPETVALIEKVKANEHLHRSPEFTVYATGLIYASACTTLPDAELVERMNAVPSGTTNGWQVCPEDFRDGTPNGSTCPDKPTHRHILFWC